MSEDATQTCPIEGTPVGPVINLSLLALTTQCCPGPVVPQSYVRAGERWTQTGRENLAKGIQTRLLLGIRSPHKVKIAPLPPFSRDLEQVLSPSEPQAPQRRGGPTVTAVLGRLS